MASNIYAKSYKMESRARKADEYAFISYLDDANTFSVVAVKRLIDVDQFGKGSIREKNKIYRISVERTGNKVEMEDLAMEAEQSCAYTMNTEVVSDTEEWHRRKRSTISKNQEQTSIVDKQLNDLCSFDDDEQPTYTTLTPCLFDEVQMLDPNGRRASSDKDDDDDDEKFDDDDDDLQENNNQRKNMNKNACRKNPVIGFNRKSTSTRKKRSSTTTGQQSTAKGVLADNNSSTFTYENQSSVLQSSSSSTNELHSCITQMRKQLFALSQTAEEQKKLQLEILHNQKKMTKAMRNNNIPILLESETGSPGSSTDTNTAPVTCKQTNGDEINLVQLPADRTRPNTFALACVTKLFKQEEIINMNARDLNTDSRVLLIRQAVQTKFGLDNTQTEMVWMSMLRSIKSRRRNTMARIRRNNNNHNNNNNNNNNNNDNNNNNNNNNDSNNNDNNSNNNSTHQHP